MTVYHNAQDQALQQSIAGMHGANHSGVLPRILILASTHKELDIIEQKLLEDGLIYLNSDNLDLARVIDYSRRFCHPIHAERNLELKEVNRRLTLLASETTIIPSSPYLR